MSTVEHRRAATANACKLCTPLGASLALRGIAGAVPLLHGSQGCSTYIRRYLIGHFREPVDIAASNFSEQAAIFGGGRVLTLALQNLIRQYRPSLIGVATTCLAETIGDDLPALVAEARATLGEDLPPVVTVSTPSYSGNHAEGFHRTVRALLEQLAESTPTHDRLLLLAGAQSPADLRHLRELVEAYGLGVDLLPDYSDNLDGGADGRYQAMPAGGTPLSAIRAAGGARACLQLGATLPTTEDAAALIDRRFQRPVYRCDLPVGLRASDRFFEELAHISGRAMPATLAADRSRLLDSYIDGHKYVSGRRVLIYGEEDLVVALTGFALEVGLRPVVVGGGACSRRMAGRLDDLGLDLAACHIISDADFTDLEQLGRDAGVELIIGHSKGYWLSRRLEQPLVRVGFPIHDRLGGARVRLCGYAGTQALFDRIANALITAAQDANPVGYMCM